MSCSYLLDGETRQHLRLGPGNEDPRPHLEFEGAKGSTPGQVLQGLAPLPPREQRLQQRAITLGRYLVATSRSHANVGGTCSDRVRHQRHGVDLRTRHPCGTEAGCSGAKKRG